MQFDYDFDLLIIGAGPAGLTAAVYARRANLTVGFLDKGAPGGKVTTTGFVENYPGFLNINGPELALKFFEQAQNLNAQFIFSEAINIDTKIDQYKYTFLVNNKIIRSKTVIIATGMVNRKIGCENEDLLYGKGISYCAICDGAIYRNQPVAIIGSGLSAIEEAIYMSDIASDVILIANKPKFNTESISINLLNSKKNIKVLFNTETIKFNGVSKLESISVLDKISNHSYELNVNAAFIFIGFIPMCPKVNNESFLDPYTKFINVDQNMATSIQGLFAAGDIINKKIRQISTAISDGSIAALSCVDYINSKIWN